MQRTLISSNLIYVQFCNILKKRFSIIWNKHRMLHLFYKWMSLVDPNCHFSPAVHTRETSTVKYSPLRRLQRITIITAPIISMTPSVPNTLAATIPPTLEHAGQLFWAVDSRISPSTQRTLRAAVLPFAIAYRIVHVDQSLPEWLFPRIGRRCVGLIVFTWSRCAAQRVMASTRGSHTKFCCLILVFVYDLTYGLATTTNFEQNNGRNAPWVTLHRTYRWR